MTIFSCRQIWVAFIKVWDVPYKQPLNVEAQSVTALYNGGDASKESDW